MSTVTKERKKFLDDAIAHLMGTCQSIEYAIPGGLENLNMAECLYFDDAIFCCDECGWWCDVDERSDSNRGEMLCIECAERGEMLCIECAEAYE